MFVCVHVFWKMICERVHATGAFLFRAAPQSPRQCLLAFFFKPPRLGGFERALHTLSPVVLLPFLRPVWPLLLTDTQTRRAQFPLFVYLLLLSSLGILAIGDPFVIGDPLSPPLLFPPPYGRRFPLPPPTPPPQPPPPPRVVPPCRPPRVVPPCRRLQEASCVLLAKAPPFSILHPIWQCYHPPFSQRGLSGGCCCGGPRSSAAVCGVPRGGGAPCCGRSRAARRAARDALRRKHRRCLNLRQFLRIKRMDEDTDTGFYLLPSIDHILKAQRSRHQPR